MNAIAYEAKKKPCITEGEGIINLPLLGPDMSEGYHVLQGGGEKAGFSVKKTVKD